MAKKLTTTTQAIIVFVLFCILAVLLSRAISSSNKEADRIRTDSRIEAEQLIETRQNLKEYYK